MAKQKKTKLFFCLNDRGEGRHSCCADGAGKLYRYAKEMAAEHPLVRVDVKKSGCLGHCKHGPVVQVLPADKVLRQVTKADIDQLFRKLAG